MNGDDFRYAVPLCPRRVIERDGQHGIHHTCFRPMRYSAPDNTWHCVCGNAEEGELVAARRMAA